MKFEDAQYVFTACIFFMMQVMGDLEVFYHPVLPKSGLKQKYIR